jgi:phage gpG-like protein
MITVKIEDAELQRRLNGLSESLGPSRFAQVLGDIGQNLVEGTKQRIASGQDWQGRAFAPNTEVTLSKKRGHRPLIDSGVWLSTRLYHHVSGTELTIGAGGVQAGVLQFGAAKGQFGTGKTRRFAIPWGTIPPRPYLPLTDDGRDLVPVARGEVLTTIEEYLEAETR